MEKEEEKGYIGMIGNEVREKVKGRVFIEIKKGVLKRQGGDFKEGKIEYIWIC